jgi:integrase
LPLSGVVYAFRDDLSIQFRQSGPFVLVNYFDAGTGLPGMDAFYVVRTSEVFGLRWENVDTASGEVLVAETSVRGVRKNNTKTNVARVVKLNSVARAAIQRQRQHTQMAAGAVFQHPEYLTPWDDERAFRRSFYAPTLKALGIRYRRPYNLRHSYATMMLMAGMAPAFCAKQLGHSVEMFLNTYAKWVDGVSNDLEMQRLERSFGSGLVLTTQSTS